MKLIGSTPICEHPPPSCEKYLVRQLGVDYAVTGDSIRFVLRLAAGDYRRRPIPPGSPPGAAAVLALPNWHQGLGDGSRPYVGRFDRDSIVFAMEREARVFFRVDTSPDL